jgi:hypothetical protein
VTIDKPGIAVYIIRLHIDGDNRGVNCGAAHLWRIADGVGVPVPIRIAGGVEGVRQKMVVEIGNGVDSKNTKPGMAPAHYSGRADPRETELLEAPAKADVSTTSISWAKPTPVPQTMITNAQLRINRI